MRRTPGVLALALVLVACSQSTSGGAATAAPEPTPPPAPQLDPVGVYDYTTQVEGTTMSGVFTVTGSPGAYTGTATSDLGTISLRDITVNGMELSFVGDLPDVTVLFVLTVTGNTFTGQWDAEGMVGYLTGNKR